ncbi:nucleotidyltransferase domain-containing protein [candidate division KSB1 bacterium]|nr:nucleotidyltransferase domain-containing protein [candidate division KSB1 bacterium]
MINLDKITLQAWCQSRGIDLVILFGSRATGKTHSRSDTDIALFARANHLRAQHVRLYGEMEDLLREEIDVTILDLDSDPVLLVEIYQKGKCLYESEPGLFFEQKLRAFRLFEDTAPLRALRDQALAQRIKALQNVTAHR